MIATQPRQIRAKWNLVKYLSLFDLICECAKTALLNVLAHSNSRRKMPVRQFAPIRVLKMIWRTLGAMSLHPLGKFRVRQNIHDVVATLPEKPNNINAAPNAPIPPPTGGIAIWRKSWRMLQSLSARPLLRQGKSLSNRFPSPSTPKPDLARDLAHFWRKSFSPASHPMTAEQAEGGAP